MIRRHVIRGLYGLLDLAALNHWTRANARARAAYYAEPFVKPADTQAARTADCDECDGYGEVLLTDRDLVACPMCRPDTYGADVERLYPAGGSA